MKKSFFGINGNVDINAEDIEYIKDAFSGMEINVLGSYIDIITEWIEKEKSYISIKNVPRQMPGHIKIYKSFKVSVYLWAGSY